THSVARPAIDEDVRASPQSATERSSCSPYFPARLPQSHRAAQTPEMSPQNLVETRASLRKIRPPRLQIPQALCLRGSKTPPLSSQATAAKGLCSIPAKSDPESPPPSGKTPAREQHLAPSSFPLEQALAQSNTAQEHRTVFSYLLGRRVSPQV